MSDTRDQPGAAAGSGISASGITREQIAWGVASPPRSYWPARLAVLAAMLLYLILPDRLIPGPRYVIPALDGVILAVLTLTTPHRTTEQSPVRRALAVTLIGLVTVARPAGPRAAQGRGAERTRAGLLVDRHLDDQRPRLRSLVLGARSGGPLARHDPEHREPDFLFPQMSSPGISRPGWAPGFIDYLYVSFTNATAFSPTDTMPLTPMAKALMGAQAAASLLTVALVAARAVNILS